jgi:hypothetical protein
VPTYHGTNRYSSSSAINFQSNSQQSLTTTVAATTIAASTLANSYNYQTGRWTLSWVYSAQSTTFMLSTSGLQSATSIWSAFALSDDDQMGDDDVIACKILADGTTVVEHDYNLNAGFSYPVPLSTSDSAIGLSNSAVTYSNGMLTCTFTRVNSMSTVANYRNIANPAYALFATGPVNSTGSLQYHSDRTASQTQINFPTGQQVQTTTVATSTTTVTKVPGNYSGSFTAPGYSLTWFDTATYTDFTLVGSSITATSTNIYIAMGLSSDDQMVIRILIKALIYISNYSFYLFF